MAFRMAGAEAGELSHAPEFADDVQLNRVTRASRAEVPLAGLRSAPGEESSVSQSKRGNRYAPEFRQQIIGLVRAGRKIPDVAREFGCTSWTISRWIKKQSDRERSSNQGELTASERQELLRLRQENRQLKLEREMLAKAVAWFAQEKGEK